MSGFMLVVALLLSACTPVFSLHVAVKDAVTGEPIEGAVLARTGCPRQNEHSNGSVAEVTDAKGVAEFGGTPNEYPDCQVFVAKSGYLSHHTSFSEICNGNLRDCDPSQSIVVELQPEVGQESEASAK